ncbi:MAG: leucyl/phenylalanyl-tRNA--protein transferase [Lysobacterales bacterium]
MIPWLSPGQPFPPVEEAFVRPNGLLAAGADLQPETLINAYAQGIFPWYSPGEPILWWSPDPRLIIRPANVHISRRMRRTLKQPFAVTLDRCFADVIDACAAPREGETEQDSGTWITPEMRQAYINLHQLGHAHSLEVWRDDRLVGGIYGIAVGKAFFGESMFRRARDCSKVALICLCQWLQHHEFALLDCQVESSHLLSMGASTVSRDLFCQEVRELSRHPGLVGNWQSQARPIQWAPFCPD